MKIHMPYKVLVSISVFALVISSGAFVMALPAYKQYSKSDPQLDGFVQPRSVASVVRNAQLSTVTIYCDYGSKDYFDQGSGWASDIELDIDNKYPQVVVTNFHVIENCVNEDGSIIKNSLTVETLEGKKEWPAILYDFDQDNDLAIIQTSAPVKPLKMSEYKPRAGYWVAAIGTADGYQGSVAFGNVLNIYKNEVFITANISHGNSGGPLIDNEGNVIGTNTFSMKTEQYNGAKSLDAMCAVLLKCGGKKWWQD